MSKIPGLQVLDNFLSIADCDEILAAIAGYRSEYETPLISRPHRERPLYYRVINGEEIQARLPVVQSLAERILPVVQRLTDKYVVPLSNRTVAVNVNITPAGGAYRWHYDRNAVTAVLYLNEVQGGEIEAYPNYRLVLKRSWSRMQDYLDGLLQFDLFQRLFGRKRTIPPKPGLLVIMRGDRCLHSVRPVAGEGERICVVASFDFVGVTLPQKRELDSYLYSSEEFAGKSDPNYSSK
jgi:hypothetical protein